MRFRCSKLYADLVTADGTVCVAYLAWLDAWGLRRAFAGVELYWPGGRREILQARPQAEHDAFASGDLRLSFDVPGGPFELEYATVHGAWTPDGEPPGGALRWGVKVARAEAVARWRGDRARPELRGIGYADWVEMDCPPRRLGLRLLRWGRVHGPDATLVFNAVDFRSGRSWRRAARWSGGERADWSAFGIEGAPAEVVDLPGSPGALAIDKGRPLHVGDAIDRGRFPGALARMVSSAVTGPAAEQRSLDRARWSDGASWALHEAVRFGAAP
jgi:hypothetical protein